MNIKSILPTSQIFYSLLYIYIYIYILFSLIYIYFILSYIYIYIYIYIYYSLFTYIYIYIYIYTYIHTYTHTFSTTQHHCKMVLKLIKTNIQSQSLIKLGEDEKIYFCFNSLYSRSSKCLSEYFYFVFELCQNKVRHWIFITTASKMLRWYLV